MRVSRFVVVEMLTRRGDVCWRIAELIPDSDFGIPRFKLREFDPWEVTGDPLAGMFVTPEAAENRAAELEERAAGVEYV